jgi:tRNA pseudouridine55 synthase
MWHVGTLDPLATGCLLIATENSTKLIPLLEGKDKRYRFTVDISAKTASLDLATEKVDVPYFWWWEKTAKELSDFLEKQEKQVPPIYSALHIDGKRAYEFARAWEKIELKEREIRIKDVTIHEFAPPIFDIELTISSGWYIRSLAPIIGNFFKTDGWYIKKLRRIALILSHSTEITTKDAQILEEFSGEKSLSYETVLPHIEMIPIDEQVFIDLKLWKTVSLPENKYIFWQKYLLNFKNKYISLVEYTSNGFVIIKNWV